MEETSSGRAPVKDPRTIARKYQLELCKKAVEENIIVYLGTGCGKTHIAVLLMYEFGHLFRKPKKDVCIFLAPTVPLVQQQAIVIENSTDFKVQTYFGNSKHLKNHDAWEDEVQQYEVLVMTPQILLQNLRHCFIKMELVALLIFDECHHAQLHKRHPYAQIMKEFYKIKTSQCPRIFGMTASPIIGKGGSNQSNYTKCINSLESLLDAKVCAVDDDVELESVVATPDIKVYFYGPLIMSDSGIISVYFKKLEQIKDRSIVMARDKKGDLKDLKRKMRLLWRVHDNLIFCLENLGLWGAIQAACILLTSDGVDLTEMETDDCRIDMCVAEKYLNQAISVFKCNLLNDGHDCDSLPLEALEEPFFSKKLSVLIGILQKYRERPNVNCIVFVKRIIVARSLAYILRNLKFLDFWKCEFLVGFHSGSMTRKMMNNIVERFSSGEVNLLVATNVAEEGLDIQTCCLVIRFDLPETVASFIQSRGRARMSKSECAFMVERGNQREEKLLEEFKWSENIMNKEIMKRTSSETFDHLEEATYRVDATGASISTGCSVSLLHQYCSKLPHDRYFSPMPKFFYLDDINGTVCRINLPSNSPLRQVDSHPSPSKDEARRAACLKACVELHALGALTDHLLPNPGDEKKAEPEAKIVLREQSDDEILREELHEMLVPRCLQVPWSKFENPISLHFYYIRFTPVPEDRGYRKFGIFLKIPLPEEAETMEVDLHLAHGRIVRTGLIPSGIIIFNEEEIVLAQKFQEMSLKIILDRAEFKSDFVPLGMNEAPESSLSTVYLLLPIVQHEHAEKMVVDWQTVRRCLSSPTFSYPKESIGHSRPVSNTETLELANGHVHTSDLLNSLVYSPSRNVFYFIDGILYETNAYDKMKRPEKFSYVEYYKTKFNVDLLYPEQPLLKAKQLFIAHNLLHNRLQENTEAHEVKEHFVELPPELCLLKIFGFSKDIGSSLSLLPSLMHRLENMLVAVELKNVLSASFPEGFEVTAFRVLEALTTEKCLERFSLERLEVLGDAFLKYAVGRQYFLSCEALNEGQLTKKRSRTVNNSHLYELAIRKNIQVYICDETFNPANFYVLGRPCKRLCNPDTESTLHYRRESDGIVDQPESTGKCTKSHRWLHKKTIADVVESLVGAFLVDSGFTAASAFLEWIGIKVNYDVMDIQRICKESKSNMSLINEIDVTTLENFLGYRFQHKGLLLQAFIHPSYTKHSGGCYQRLEFLGDAVLEYLITSYLYSVYPELNPGQLTDLRSITVNNNSFARIAVHRYFHNYLVRDSKSLTDAIKRFEGYVLTDDQEKDMINEPACPKVLGDIVESCMGAVLLDSGFDLNCVWKMMLNILDPILKFSNFHISPIRELQELCQYFGFNLSFPDPVKQHNGSYLVKVDVGIKNGSLTRFATNRSSKAARRLASQEVLSDLKALGHKHKNKSLEEVVRTTRKGLPELIGFDEKPVVVDVDVDVSESIHLDKLQLNDSEESSSRPSSRHAWLVNSHTPKRVLNRKHSLPEFSGVLHLGETEETTSSSKTKQKAVEGHPPGPIDSSKFNSGGKAKVNAKSRLYEICAANYWNPPSFACCKEEGLSHMKVFTYKVIVAVEGAPDTILECFGEPRQKKIAAQEHAAEGALWCLKHLGYA